MCLVWIQDNYNYGGLGLLYRRLGSHLSAVKPMRPLSLPLLLLFLTALLSYNYYTRNCDCFKITHCCAENQQVIISPVHFKAFQKNNLEKIYIRGHSKRSLHMMPKVGIRITILVLRKKKISTEYYFPKSWDYSIISIVRH